MSMFQMPIFLLTAYRFLFGRDLTTRRVENKKDKSNLIQY